MTTTFKISVLSIYTVLLLYFNARQINSFTKKDLIQYKKNLTLNPIQKDIIIGTLLGDSTMGLASGKPKYSLKFEQRMEKADYVWNLYFEMSNYVGTPPEVRYSKQVPKSVWFRTYRHPTLQPYFDLFYVIEPDPKNRNKVRSRKVVPLNIRKLLTPRAIAYWFMDDGTFTTNRNGSKCYYLSTHGFRKTESKLLCRALKKNFNLSCTLHKDTSYWKIYIKAASSATFKSLVQPYIVPCFQYKL